MSRPWIMIGYIEGFNYNVECNLTSGDWKLRAIGRSREHALKNAFAVIGISNPPTRDQSSISINGKEHDII